MLNTQDKKLLALIWQCFRHEYKPQIFYNTFLFVKCPGDFTQMSQILIDLDLATKISEYDANVNMRRRLDLCAVD